ncbi:type I polyketide synthase [Dolichospermum sp. UHCC 0259]|uniref:type I polyketide synthase n=1 Tax=Dolichospermum sp. UHCC 0259 TaxID=2590010 RepID=UPI0014460312|nr:type I polyketide synthase [Dolichospermum sp. UHCC 0259]MTJ47022.1 SDR family NAD(P)-dependent oxidoreductase [Dolichospermum sp. UHCC 0259]
MSLLPNNDSQQQFNESDIAIVGMSCRFPGAENIDEFWKNLSNGVESISFFSDQELDFFDPSLLSHPNYVKAGAVLANIDLFDADFFSYSAKEAEIMDPQQRIFLECAWEALESAGYNPEIRKESVGVYAGSSLSTYLINNVCPSRGFSPQRPFLSHRLFRAASDLHIEQGNGSDHLPMRVSYKLGLTGPSVNVQTTCSTSLVAVHLACQSLHFGECDVALAGGISIFVPHRIGYLYREGMILSPDGHCRAFDADAQGTVFGNGAGVVVLKLLSKALAEGDTIHAVIKGSAVNNDGAHKMSYTSPSIHGQVAAISEALAVSGVDASTVSYVEAHGTGTALGDPIEITALTQAFRQSTEENTDKNGFCAIGSVKTNIGHLDDASGIAGLIKTVLSLKHHAIPPSLNFSRPNPNIDFANTPFYVNTDLAEWKRGEMPRRAGVSSFGMGGTNCHIVLEESPQTRARLRSRSVPEGTSTTASSSHSLERKLHLLTLSAKTETALKELVQRYVDYLDTNLDVDIGNICFTANTGRKHFHHRLAIVADSKANVRSQLQVFIQNEYKKQKLTRPKAHVLKAVTTKKIGFLFTGQGSQYISMGRQLYESEPTFRENLDRCNQILNEYLEVSLLEILYPDNSDSPSELDSTAYTQPALFALEYSLAQLWKSWGIQPDVVIGHSVGEYVAACIAGIFSLEDGLKLIAHRSRLMQALPQNGEMVAVLAPEQEVLSAIRPYAQQVSLAAINGTQSIVISGHQEAIQATCAIFETQGVKTKKLRVSHGFHSPLMEPMLAEFEQVARQVHFSPPQIPLISNVTGEIITDAITTPEYWCQHILQPVRFAQSMERLGQLGVEVFIEIGPQSTLLGMGRQCLPADDYRLWLPSLHPEQGDWQTLLTSLAELYLHGVTINWEGFDRDCLRQRVVLPTYPFQRRQYWVDAPATHQTPVALPLNNSSTLDGSHHPLLGEPLSLAGTRELRFQGQISKYFPVWLSDHRVFETTILPGTAYLDMALAAGATIAQSGQSCRLEGVTIQKALVIPEEGETKPLQMVLQPEDSTTYAFQIFSPDPSPPEDKGQPAWNLHAAGKLYLSKTETPATVNLKELQQQITEEISVADLYHKFQQQQIDYGLSFRAVKQVWRNQDRALGHIVLPESVALDLDNYQLHPVLLDICLQVLDATLLEEQEETYVPVLFQELRFFGQPSNQMWCDANLHKRESDRPETLNADIKLFSPQGQLIAEMNGLQLKRVRRQTMFGKNQNTEQDWLYEVEWREQNHKSITIDNYHSQPRHWLIFADSSHIGQELAALLRDQGEICILVLPGQDYEAISAHEYHLNPAAPEHFQQLLVSLPLIEGIVHAWGWEQPETLTPEILEQRALLSCGSVLHLVQTLAKSNISVPPLWIITKGGQAIQEHSVQALIPSLVWGMGKTIALEHPAMRVIRIDLDPGVTTTESALAVFAEVFPPLSADTMEDQIAFRNQVRYVARLVRRQSSNALGGQTALAIPENQPFRLAIANRGTPDNLQLQATNRQQIADGEVEIRVYSAGLNFIDVLNVLGLYPGEPPLGIECAGEIVAIGAGVIGLEIGDAVIAIASGGFSQYVTVDANLVVLKPTTLTFEEAATIPESFLTAYWSLHHLAKIAPGDRVLIHAAAGGVGQAAVQLALLAGAEVFATASPSKWAVLEAMGVKVVMNSRTLDFAQEIIALTQGQGVDIILNSLTGEGFIASSLSVLAENGRFLELAKRDIWSPEQMTHLRPDVSYFKIDTTKACQEEAPAIQLMLRHLVQQFENHDLKPLAKTVFPIQSAVTAFRYMQQAKHIGKIVLTLPASALVQGDGSYLITGGFGGLGLLVARWLVEQGARYLILMGRSDIPAAIAPQISEMEQAGATVITIQADVSNLLEATAVFSHLTKTAPPLRGIIHAAGILDDGVLQQQTWQRFIQVMAPKVQGAWNLHTLTKNQPLDFFVLFSSSASLLGTAGQANYGAANAFLDALASYRRRQGLSGLSINWGPWAEVGMTAKLQLGDRLRQKGEDSIPPQQGLQILGKLLQQSPVQVGVMPMNWERFLERQQRLTPFFSELYDPLAQRVGQLSAIEFRKHLETLPLEECKAALKTHVCTQAAKILGIGTPQQVPTDQRLVDLGLDSLMAIEFLSLVQSSMGTSLSSVLLFNYPTVDALVDYLCQQFVAPEDADSLPQANGKGSHGALQVTNNRVNTQHHSTIIAIQPQGTKIPLFCVAGILGSVFDFYGLARHIGADQPFYGLRSLGLMVGEQALTPMADIAAYHIKAIQEIQPQGPYQLAGHSFGGKVAFEIAQQLSHQGQEVSLLAIMDIPAVLAGSDRVIATWDDVQYITKLAEIYGGASGKQLETSPEILSKLDAEAQLKLLLKQVQTTGQKLTLPELQQIFSVYRANMIADTAYVPQPTDIPITLFRGKEMGQLDFLPDAATTQTDPTWGWHQVSTQPIQLHLVPGNHFTMVKEPDVQVLAQKLKTILALKIADGKV